MQKLKHEPASGTLPAAGSCCDGGKTVHGRIGQKLWHRAVLKEQEDGGSMTQEKQVPETEVCYGKIYRPERAVKIIKKDGSRGRGDFTLRRL